MAMERFKVLEAPLVVRSKTEVPELDPKPSSRPFFETDLDLVVSNPW